MIFWSIRLVLLLATLPLLLSDWRQAVVVAYVLVVDFMVMIGMILPGFGIWNTFLLVFPVSIVIGIVLSLDKEPSRAPLWVSLLTLLVLHFSPYADGLLDGEVRGALVLATLPVLWVLVLAVGLGIEVPLQVRRLLVAWLRARKRKAGREESEKFIR